MDYFKYHAAIANFILKEFGEEFYQVQGKIKKNLKDFGIDVAKALPAALNSNKFKIDAVYSDDKKQVLINFKSNENFNVTTYAGKGDVIDYLDNTGIWRKSEPLMKGIDSKISIHNGTFSGGKPFAIEGDLSEIFISNINFQLPDLTEQTIEFAIAMSLNNFMAAKNDLDNYIMGIYNTFWSFYEETKQRLVPGTDSARTYLGRMVEIQKEMDSIFFDEKKSEHEIERFILRNPVILEQGLDLMRPQPQIKLKDVMGKIGQDLKPDVIALNPITNRWVIIDYKLGRKIKLIKDPNGVRTTFFSQVHSLQAQLRTYRKYFDEYLHREDFRKRYKFHIDEYPNTIGLIGYVDSDSRKDFEELVSDHPRWFTLIPYNDLREKFARFIETIRKLQ